MEPSPRIAATSEALRLPPKDTFLTVSDESPLELPVIGFVTYLYTIASSGTTPHPNALCYIVSRMPSLQNLRLEMWQPSMEARDLRIEHRRALAKGVANFIHSIPNLASLEMLYVNSPDLVNDSFDNPDFTENGVDPLSTAIRTIGEAGKLKRLDMVSISITSDLLCTRQTLESTQSAENDLMCGSTWPSMQYMNVRCQMMTADGRWLYTGDPNAPRARWDDEEDSDSMNGSFDETDNSSDEMDEDNISVISATSPHLLNSWRTKPDITLYNL